MRSKPGLSRLCSARSRRPNSSEEGSAHVQELDIEHQGGSGRNIRGSAGRSVAEIGRNDELATSPPLHARHTLVPTGNYLTRAQGKSERLIAVSAAVELFAVGEPAGIVDRNSLPSTRHGTGTDAHILVAEAGRRPGQSRCVDLESSTEPALPRRSTAVGLVSAGDQAHDER